MNDLEDLNRTLYDMGAQDLLDGWDAIDAEETSAEATYMNNAGGAGGIPSLFGSSLGSHGGGVESLSVTPVVLKDRLLTDSVVPPDEYVTNHSALMSMEHGYSSANQSSCSINNAHGIVQRQNCLPAYNVGGSTGAARQTGSAGSDGDSMPESPLSLDDDMETECYPCIPMRSASNQNKLDVSGIKRESLSEDEQELGEDDDYDEQQNLVVEVGDGQLDNSNKMRRRKPKAPTKYNVQAKKHQNGLSIAVIQSSYLVNNNNNGAGIEITRKLQQDGAALPICLKAAALPRLQPFALLPQQQTRQKSTTKLTRVKHPQSLLKPHRTLSLVEPSTATVLVTGSAMSKGSAATAPVTTAKLKPFTFLSSKTNNTVITFSRSSGINQNQSISSVLSPPSAPSVVSASTSLPGRTIKTEPCDGQCTPNSSNQPAAAAAAANLHSNLISRQPTDGATGVLVLTEEEKRTLVSEGYPIPAKLPLTKSEEKCLKKVRRKIKNKISAQESRRKKKEFVDTLEQKVNLSTAKVDAYKKRCENLQKQNASLLSQLNALRAMLVSGSSCATTTSSPSITMDVKLKSEPVDVEGLETIIKIEPEVFDQDMESGGLELD